MKQRGVAILSLVCGIVCAACVFAYTQQVEASAAAQRNEALERYGGDQVEVCVATRAIAAGEYADATNTTTRPWLVDLLPEDPVTSLADVAGVQAASPVVAGEVLSHVRFSSSGPSVSVPAGLQAVGVELSSAQAVGGTLEAGAVVDVYAAGSSGTALIACNVLVVSAAEGAGGRSSVTLAVEPSNVEEVIATTQSAVLYLTLPSKEEGE
ncbi:MAG: Flp pilus assembly protein CpaB [Eggerthellaceae bacterium]|nr:Flp pilus assembly protein CpaB [Eggerthellaceae bacterium]